MNPHAPRLHRTARCVGSWCAAFSLWLVSAPALDSIQIRHQAFHADGLLLEPEETERLVEVLSALVRSNLPDDSTPTDPAREELVKKALSLALTVAPEHPDTRKMWRDLSAGRMPEATGETPTPAQIADDLWQQSLFLIRDVAEPDALKLASYLMELSLLQAGEASDDQLQQFGEWIRQHPLSWQELYHTASTATDSPGMVLAARALERTAPAPPPPAPMNEPVPPPVPEDPEPPSPEPPATLLEPVQRSIHGLFLVNASPAYIASGVLHLEIRPVSGEDEIFHRDVLKLDPDGNPTLLPIDYDTGQPALGRVRIPERIAQRRNWPWPANAIGRVSFTPGELLQSGLPAEPFQTGAGSTRRRQPTANPFTNLHTLIEMALSDLHPREDVFLGPENWERIETESLEATFADARRAGARHVLVAETAQDSLLEHLVQSERSDLFFQLSLLSYRNDREKLRLLTGEWSPELLEAMEQFATIQTASTNLPPEQFVRNPHVIQKLEEITRLSPQHLGARLLHTLGSSPPSRDAALEQRKKHLIRLITPLLDIASDDDGQHRDLLPRLEAIDLELRQARRDLPLEIKSHLDAAMALLEASQRYLQLSNRTTAMGQQRYRDYQNALLRWQELEPPQSEP